MFGIGCVGVFQITTWFQEYPQGNYAQVETHASGMPPDTPNPKGVKTPKHDKIRDESWGKVYSHEYPHHLQITVLAAEYQNLFDLTVNSIVT